MTRAYNTATTQQNSGGAVAGVTAGKNAVINGGFDIWQRGTSFSNFVAIYTADRWLPYRSGSVTGFTVSRQSSGLTGIQYSMRTQRDSGNTSTQDIYNTYALESVDSYRFAGQTVTLSFYAKVGANFSGASSNGIAFLYSGTGTDQNLYNGFTGRVTVGSSTPALTTSWQRFTITGTVASNATQMGLLIGYVPTGTAGANDWIEITGVQLEVGSVATPFSRAGGDIQGELAKCQRYYYRHNGVDEDYIVPIWCNSSTRANGFYWTPVLMRVSPTLETTGVAGNYKVVVNGVVTTCTSVPTKDNGSNNYFGAIVISFPASGFTNATAGTAVFETGPGASFVGFSAEL